MTADASKRDCVPHETPAPAFADEGSQKSFPPNFKDWISNSTDDPERTVPPAPIESSPPRTAGSPTRIGRYRIDGLLGQGGFGAVYQGYDEDLNRPVAIKVPHSYRVAEPRDVEAYLDEARVLASLDHPGIVPGFDVGRTDDGMCYVVSKFIPGCNVREKLRSKSLTRTESAELIATVAEALHHAHDVPRHG